MLTNYLKTYSKIIPHPIVIATVNQFQKEKKKKIKAQVYYTGKFIIKVYYSGISKWKGAN